MKRSSFAPSIWLCAGVLVSQLVSVGPPSGEIASVTAVVTGATQAPAQTPSQNAPLQRIPTSPFEIIYISEKQDGLNIVGGDSICSSARHYLYFNFFLTEMLLCTTVRSFEHPYVHKPPWV